MVSPYCSALSKSASAIESCVLRINPTGGLSKSLNGLSSQTLEKTLIALIIL